MVKALSEISTVTAGMGTGVGVGVGVALQAASAPINSAAAASRHPVAIHRLPIMCFSLLQLNL